MRTYYLVSHRQLSEWGWGMNVYSPEYETVEEALERVKLLLGEGFNEVNVSRIKEGV